MCLAAALIGCQNLKDIRSYTDEANAAASSFPAVAATAYNACIEEERYKFLRDQRTFAPAAAVFDAAGPAVRETCGAQAKTRDRLVAAFLVVNTYLATLGKLAADNVAVYDKRIDAISSNAGTLLGFTSDQQQAVGALAKLIISAFTNGWRHGKLQEAIGTAQQPMQVVLDAIAKDLQQFESTGLRVQKGALDSFYQDVQLSRPNESPAILAYQYNQELGSIERQREAVESYLKILDQIKQGHTKLFEARNQLGSRDTLLSVFQTAVSIRDNLQAVRKAFGSAG